MFLSNVKNSVRIQKVSFRTVFVNLWYKAAIMKTITVKINDHTKLGRSNLDLLHSFPKDKNVVEILESPYDPKFVAEIKARKKNQEGGNLAPMFS